jgi:hypothetical protein
MDGEASSRKFSFLDNPTHLRANYFAVETVYEYSIKMNVWPTPDISQAS